MAKPIDKQYLIDNMKTFVNVILDPRYIIQKTVLPAATADNLGTVFQYIGSDSTNYTIGGFYQSTEVTPSTTPKTYFWKEITSKTLIDNTTIKENASKEIYVPKATDTTLGVVTDGDGTSIGANGEVNVVDRLEETTTLPTASASIVGKRYLYAGASTSTLTHGGIYECQETSTDVYEWVLISTSPLTFNSDDFDVVDDEVSLDASQKIKTFTQAEWDALSSAEKIALAGQNVIISDDEGTQTFEDIIPSDASTSNQLVTENSISTKVGAITGSGITYRTFTCTLSNATAGYQNHEFLLVTREENVLINARIHTDGTLNVTACDINGEANTITNIGYAFDNTTRTLTIGVTLASWAMTLSVVKITYPKDVASAPIVVSTLPTLTNVTIKKLVTESDLAIKKKDISATGGATSFSTTIPLSMAQRNIPFYLEVLSVGNDNAIKEMRYRVFVSSMNTNVTTQEISKDSNFTNVSITFDASTGYALSFSSTETLYSTTLYIQQ